MTTAGPWGLRVQYGSPFVLLVVAAIFFADTPFAFVAVVIAVPAVVRAARIALVTSSGEIIVRNFWSSYRISRSDLVAMQRVQLTGFVGMIRWPHSVIETRARDGSQIRVYATANASFWGDHSGEAAEMALRAVLSQRDAGREG